MGARFRHKPRHRWEKEREDWEQKPVISHEGPDGRKQFFHNPFYREPDILSQLILEWEDPEGRKRTILNPLRAPIEYGEGSTYERLRQKHNWFFQPEVDPW